MGLEGHHASQNPLLKDAIILTKKKNPSNNIKSIKKKKTVSENPTIMDLEQIASVHPYGT